MLHLLLLAAVVYPSHPAGRCVFDPSSRLATSDLTALESECERLDRAGRAAIAVAVVTDMQGESRPEYAVGLFKAWKLGHRGRDDGLLILLALPPAERGIKVEVGYGLEGSLPDGKVMAILREKAVPDLKAGRLGVALLTLMREYGAAAEAQVAPARALRQMPASAASAPKTGLPWWPWCLIVLAGVGVLGWILWLIFRDDEPAPPPAREAARPREPPAGTESWRRRRTYEDPSPQVVILQAPPIIEERTTIIETPVYRQEPERYTPPAAEPETSSWSGSSTSDSGSSWGGSSADSSSSSDTGFSGFDGGQSGGGGGDTDF